MGRSGLYLNVDILHKAFPSSMPLLDFVSSLTRDGRIPRDLDGRQMFSLESHLKMLSIGYRLSPNDPVKTYGFNRLIKPNEATFKDENNRTMTVADYFRMKKGINLRYPNMPYLWVGSRNKNIYLPLEFCEIPAGQATNKKCTPNTTAEIIKFSATTTDERKRKIQEKLKRIDYSSNPTVAGFGINVDKNFQKIEGRVIDPPEIRYANGTVTPRDGVWREKRYINSAQSANEFNWCIINCDDRTSDENLLSFADQFVNELLQELRTFV